MLILIQNSALKEKNIKTDEEQAVSTYSPAFLLSILFITNSLALLSEEATVGISPTLTPLLFTQKLEGAL